MKPIKTILVDDEPFSLTALDKLLQINCPEIYISGMYTNSTRAFNEIKTLHPDLVFLDIKMPGKSGIDLLRDFGPLPFEVIFVTAYNEFIMQTFEFSAVDYLLKPVDEELLVKAVNRAVDRIQTKAEKLSIETLLHNLRQFQQPLHMKLCIPSIKGFQVVQVSDIMYCEASSSYTNFYFADRPVICAAKTLQEYEILLTDSHFIRLHKSYLVNMEYIKEYVRGDGGHVILANGKEIEVSRRKKDILISKMKAYYKL